METMTAITGDMGSQAVLAKWWVSLRVELDRRAL